MRSGEARKKFPNISVNNVITLATRIRIHLLKVSKSISTLLCKSAAPRNFNFFIYLFIYRPRSRNNALSTVLIAVMSVLYHRHPCFVFSGHRRGVPPSAPSWLRRGHPVSEQARDHLPCGEEPQADHHELCRGHFFTRHAFDCILLLIILCYF